MAGCGHTSVQRGKRVLVVMVGGDHIVAKFKEHRDRWIHFYDREKISTKAIRTLSLYRPTERSART